MKGVVIDSKVLVTCCVLSILGSLAYNILPVFLGTIGRHFALDDAQLGLLGSSSMAGAALTSLAAPFWMPRTNWKAVSIAGIAMLLLSILALAYTPKGALLQLYSILFVFGAGGIILFTLGLTILARSRDVERAYGIKMLAENIAATLFAYLLGTVIVMQFGFQGFLVAAALIYGAGLFFVGGLPRNFLKAEAAESTRESDASGLAGSNALAWAATVALLVWFAGFSAIWSFMERIGISAGLAHEAVDSILSLSIAASIVGALAATALGNRLGILGPLAAGLLLACSAVIALGASPGRIAFIFGASVFIGTLPFVLAYLLGLIAAVDRSGKVIVIVPLIMTAGGAFGPGILGLTVKGGDFTPGYWAFGCISIAVAAGSYWIERLHLSAPLDTVRSPFGPL